MYNPTQYPLILLVLSFFALLLSARVYDRTGNGISLEEIERIVI